MRKRATVAASAVIAILLPLAAAIPANALTSGAISISDNGYAYEGGVIAYNVTVASDSTERKLCLQFLDPGGSQGAVGGADYAAAPPPCEIIPAGSGLNKNYTIQTYADGVPDYDREYFEIIGDVRTTVGDRHVAFTSAYADIYQPVMVSVGDQAVFEGNAGTLRATFSSYLVAPRSDGSINFTVTVDDSSAVRGSDYTFPQSSVVSVANGQTGFNIAIPTLNDAEQEPAESLTVTVSANDPAVTGFSDPTGALTIHASDAPISYEVGDAEPVSETDTHGPLLRYPVTISQAPGPNERLLVRYDTPPQSEATAGEDYYDIPADYFYSMEFTSSTPLTQFIQVGVIGDDVVESTEAVSISTSTPFSPSTTSVKRTAVGSILDDDVAAPVASIALDQPAVHEGSPIGFTVILDKPAAEPTSVKVATSDGTATLADGDYTALTTTVSIAAGLTSSHVETPTAADPKREGDETFTLTLSDPQGVTIGTGEAVATITNDDPLPTLRVTGPGSVTEASPGAESATFTILASNPADTDTTVLYVIEGSATPDQDFATGQTGTVTFAAGEASQTVAVPVLDDNRHEGDQNVNLRITDAGSFSGDVQGADASFTIVSDDPAPVATVGDAAAPEGDSGETNIASLFILDRASELETHVYYRVAAPDGSGVLQEGEAVLFLPLETSKSVFATRVTGDTKFEPDTAAAISVHDTDGGGDTGTVTVTNDDAQPTLSVSDAEVVEGNDGDSYLAFTLITTGNADGGSVSYTTSDGTATAGADYTASTGRMTFDAADSRRLVSIRVVPDTAVEGDETLRVTLSEATSFSIVDAVGNGTIKNDDAAAPPPDPSPEAVQPEPAPVVPPSGSSDAASPVLPAATPLPTTSVSPTPTPTPTPTTSSPTASAPLSQTAGFAATDPVRVLDTRDGTGAAMAGQQSGPVVIDLAGMLPTGTRTVLLNVTATGASKAGHVTAYAFGARMPSTSNLNFSAGRTQANLVAVQVGADSKVVLHITGSVHLLADLAGTYAAGKGFSSGTPVRALDTRIGAGGASGTLGPVAVRLPAGAPAGATHVLLNVTVTGATGSGHVVARDAVTSKPGTSSLNYSQGLTQANLVPVEIGQDGTVVLQASGAAAHLIADVLGYWTSGLTGEPGRLLDTRSPSGGSRAANDRDRVTVTLPPSPTGARTVLLNLTVTGATAPGHAVVLPAGGTDPGTSNVNWARGQTQANLVAVEVPPRGGVDVLVHAAGGGAHVLVDFVGWQN